MYLCFKICEGMSKQHFLCINIYFRDLTLESQINDVSTVRLKVPNSGNSGIRFPLLLNKLKSSFVA